MVMLPIKEISPIAEFAYGAWQHTIPWINFISAHGTKSQAVLKRVYNAKLIQNYSMHADESDSYILFPDEETRTVFLLRYS